MSRLTLVSIRHPVCLYQVQRFPLALVSYTKGLLPKVVEYDATGMRMGWNQNNASTILFSCLLEASIWQCSNKAGYRAEEFDKTAEEDGRGSGCWSFVRTAAKNPVASLVC